MDWEETTICNELLSLKCVLFVSWFHDLKVSAAAYHKKIVS